MGHAADGPAGGPWGAPREPAGGAVDGLARRPGAAAVRHHGGIGAGAGGVGAADGQGDQGRPHGAHPRLLQHLEPQGRGALHQHLAQPQDGAVHVRRGDGEAEPGGQGHHGGRLREAVQADLRFWPRRAREEDVRLLPVHGHGPRRRHALPDQHERRLLQRPPALLLRAVGPDRLELLQDHDPAGQARRRRARHGQGEPAGEVHPHRHRGLARLLVHGLRQLRQGRASPGRGRLLVAAPRRRSRRGAGAGAGTHLRVIG